MKHSKSQVLLLCIKSPFNLEFIQGKKSANFLLKCRDRHRKVETAPPNRMINAWNALSSLHINLPSRQASQLLFSYKSITIRFYKQDTIVTHRRCLHTSGRIPTRHQAQCETSDTDTSMILPMCTTSYARTQQRELSLMDVNLNTYQYQSSLNTLLNANSYRVARNLLTLSHEVSLLNAVKILTV